MNKRIPVEGLPSRTDEELEARAVELRDVVTRRRTVRDFSTRPIPDRVLDACLAVAASAPSGANQQPWHFVVVKDPAVKHRIRLEAEAEEQVFYKGRAPDEWLDALAPLATDANKPFLEKAPCLVVIFAETYGLEDDGQRRKHYYVQESVGIATGMLISTLHQVGLATLTHTPSPMRFLNEILDRPANERPYLILVVGHPAAEATVPDIERKPLDEVTSRS
jgi:nitroreductase